MSRQFTETDQNSKVDKPLVIGLYGPSTSGKTYSALRLATGIQSVVGGEIGFIDTEACRALAYKDEFSFRHLNFGAPFDPLSYLEAIKHFVDGGCKTVIVDSMTHEHDGVGGVLEMHEAEMDRMAGNDWKKRERVNQAAWIKPKAARRKLINYIVQQNLRLIMCFRAKEKTKPVKGGGIVNLGWMHVGGDEFAYECILRALLPPGSRGVPRWESEEIGEKLIINLPRQFADMFADGRPLDEKHGAALAQWNVGKSSSAPPPPPPTKTTENATVTPEDKAAYIKLLHNAANLASLQAHFKSAWNWAKKDGDTESQQAIKAKYDECKARFS